MTVAGDDTPDPEPIVADPVLPVPGAVLPPWRVDPVQEWPMKVLAVLLDDPNRIHWDVANVRALGLGDRPVNQGPANVGYIVNMLLAWVGSPGAVRRVAVRFHGNVLAGDVVEATGVVTRVDRGPDDTRRVVLDVALERDDGTRPVTGVAEVDWPGPA